MLTIVLATRGRPHLLVPTVQRTLENVREPDTRMVICADEDDLETLATKSQLEGPAQGPEPARVLWSVEPRPDSLGTKYNRGARAAPAEVYLLMVDYAPHMTEGFDTRILEAARTYPDGYALVLNHLDNLSFSGINAVTHKLAVAMGGLWPEHFPYWFGDHWLEEMARRIGRAVFCDVRIDNSARPGTMGKKEPYLWGTYFGALAPMRAAIADRIIDSPDFDETPARKAALKRNYSIHDDWSRRINELLAREPGEPVDPSDEHYARLRARAIAAVGEPAASVQTPSLFVATPMYGGQCYGAYAASMLTFAGLCAQRGIQFDFYGVLNESHIDRGRNLCVNEFLRGKMSHMFFIDSDISFESEDALSLLKWDKDIICGFYPRKSINWRKVSEAIRFNLTEDPESLKFFAGDMVFNPLSLADGGNPKKDQSIYEPIRVYEGGTGFMLIKREVFERIRAQSYRVNGAGSKEVKVYFDAKIEPGGTRFLSEDYDFCRLAREAGVEIWLAPWVKLVHHGYYPYMGDIEAIAAAQGAGRG